MNLYYRCKKGSGRGYDKSVIYFDLKKLGMVKIFTFVYYKQIKSIINDKSRIFIIEETPLDPPVTQIASLNYVERSERGENSDYGYGAIHCTSGINLFSKIYSYELTEKRKRENEDLNEPNKEQKIGFGGKKTKRRNSNKRKKTRKYYRYRYRYR